MEKIIDGLMTAILTLAFASGGTYALRTGFIWVRKAALTKAAHGLPPLGPVTRKMTGMDRR